MSARSFRFNEAARDEFENAVARYDAERPGLGAQFLLAVENKINFILEAPHRWPLRGGVRWVRLWRFPYRIVYRDVDESQIEIVAVAHFKRQPAYWSRR